MSSLSTMIAMLMVLVAAGTALATQGSTSGNVLLITENMDDLFMPVNIRMRDLASHLRTDGQSVSLLCVSGGFHADFSNELAAIGVDMYSISDEAFLTKDLLAHQQFDTAMMYLWFWRDMSIPEMYMDLLRQESPKTSVVVLTDDMHGSRHQELRAGFEALTRAGDNRAWASVFPRLFDDDYITRIAARERAVYEAADLVLTASEADWEFLKASGVSTPSAPLHFVHNLTRRALPTSNDQASFEDRDSIVFLGYGANPTNRLALEWFFSAVYPMLPERMQSVRFILAGLPPRDGYQSLMASGATIEVVSMTTDEQLASLLASSRVMMAPTVAATGVVTKVLYGLQSGIPVVTTPTGAQGFLWQSLESSVFQDGLTIAQSASEYALRLSMVYSDKATWTQARQGGLELITEQMDSRMFNRDVTSAISFLETKPQSSSPYSSGSFIAARKLTSYEADKRSRRFSVMAGSEGGTPPVVITFAITNAYETRAVMDFQADVASTVYWCAIETTSLSGNPSVDDCKTGAPISSVIGSESFGTLDIGTDITFNCSGLTERTDYTIFITACLLSNDNDCTTPASNSTTFTTTASDCTSPCQNGGTCNAIPDTCSCAAGYSGDHCETDVDNCSGVDCLNGGTCVDGVDSYTCSCVAGYSGDHCETDVDNCSGVDCLNGGTCVDGVDSYTCSCVAGYSGDHCETDVDNCSGVDCLNGGTCVDGVDSYTCSCMAGYSGDHCESNVDDCSAVDCQNGGTCVDGVDGYSCDCVTGYSGEHCESNVDDCADVTCENGGTCVDGVDGYTCSCATGYSGEHCETDIVAPSSSNIVVTGVTENGFTLRAELNEVGSIFYGVYPSGAATPSVSDVVSGTNAVLSGSIAVAAGDVGEVVETHVTGLESETSYAVYVVGQDEAGNNEAAVSESLTGPFTTIDVTGPTVFESESSEPSRDGVDFVLTMSEDCTIYWVVLVEGASPPSAAQIEDGTGAVKMGSLSATANNANQVTVTGLESENSYTIYSVAIDLSGNPSAVSNVGSFTTLPLDDPNEIAYTGFDDCTVNAGSPNSNDGSSTSLTIPLDHDGAAMLYMEVSAENQLEFESVALRLHVTESSGWPASSTLDLVRLPQDFDPTATTWNCAYDEDTSNNAADCEESTWTLADPTFGTVITTIPISDSTFGWRSINITAEWLAVIKDQVPNHGWILRPTDSTNHGTVTFSSADSSNPPELSVVFTDEGLSASKPIGPVCEGDDVTLTCEEGTTILVTSASYGRHNDWSCPDSSGKKMDNTDCSSPSSLSTLADACDGQTTCFVVAETSTFGDSCKQTAKYLEGRYMCIPPPPDYCASSPCGTGDCQNQAEGFRCVCPADKRGETCSEDAEEIPELVSFWSFNDGTGYDSVGDNHGSMGSTAPGYHGAGLVMQQDSPMTIPHNETLDMTSEMTIAFWVKPYEFRKVRSVWVDKGYWQAKVDLEDCSPGDEATYPECDEDLQEKWQQDDEDLSEEERAKKNKKRQRRIRRKKGAFTIFQRRGRKGKLTLKYRREKKHLTLKHNQGVSSNEWHFVAFVFSESEQRFYVDGDMISRSDFADKGPLLTTGLPMLFGTGWARKQYTSDGLMDNIALWRTALTPEQIDTVRTSRWYLDLVDGDGTVLVNDTAALSQPIGHWQFDEEDGTDSAMDHHATMEEDFVSSNGKFGRAFRTTGEAMSVLHTQTIQMDEEFSVTLWVQVHELKGQRALVSKGGGKGKRGWELSISQHKKKSHIIASMGRGRKQRIRWKLDSLWGEDWNFVALTMNLTHQMLYLNNAPPLVATEAIGGIRHNENPFWIGGSKNGNRNKGDVSIDEVQLYSVYLDPTDIAAIRTSTTPAVEDESEEEPVYTLPYESDTDLAFGDEPVFGCSDGTREGFTDLNEFPDIAACAGGWTVEGLYTEASCNYESGNHGSALEGCSVADLCEAGWHVCAGPEEVIERSGNEDGCSASNVDWAVDGFYATKTSGKGGRHCDDEGTNDFFGCGNEGDTNLNKDCAGLNRMSFDRCRTMPDGWECAADKKAEALTVTHTDNLHGGAMCCRDAETTGIVEELRPQDEVFKIECDWDWNFFDEYEGWSFAWDVQVVMDDILGLPAVEDDDDDEGNNSKSDKSESDNDSSSDSKRSGSDSDSDSDDGSRRQCVKPVKATKGNSRGRGRRLLDEDTEESFTSVLYLRVQPGLGGAAAQYRSAALLALQSDETLSNDYAVVSSLAVSSCPDGSVQEDCAGHEARQTEEIPEGYLDTLEEEAEAEQLASSSPVVTALSVVGGLVVAGGIAYAVYRYQTHKKVDPSFDSQNAIYAAQTSSAADGHDVETRGEQSTYWVVKNKGGKAKAADGLSGVVV